MSLKFKWFKKVERAKSFLYVLAMLYILQFCKVYLLLVCTYRQIARRCRRPDSIVFQHTYIGGSNLHVLSHFIVQNDEGGGGGGRCQCVCQKKLSLDLY